MLRAKLSYEQRLLMEEALKQGKPNLEICEELGISSLQLTLEKRLGWIEQEGRYSAWTAQTSLR